ncbi:MAG: hypothetical protein ACOZEN_08780 [Thermodesulfobacteriota bacterium]
MARLASHVRADSRLKLACTVCVSGNVDCTRVNEICGYPSGICRVDASEGKLEEFVAEGNRRAAGR